MGEKKHNEKSINCPLCQESIGKNFKGSGDRKDDFICNKCYSYKRNDLFFECKICNGKFCTLCPQNKYEKFPSCPFCCSQIGKNFKIKNFKYRYTIDSCFKCTKKRHSAIIKRVNGDSIVFYCIDCNCYFCNYCSYNSNCDFCGS